MVAQGTQGGPRADENAVGWLDRRMSLFRRTRREAEPGSTPAAIAAFWQWWTSAAEGVTRDLDSGGVDHLPGLVAPRVAAVHRNLEWEFVPGRSARHALVVSSGGEPELRSVTERWRRAGPPDDETWEFRPARQADPAGLRATIMIAERAVDLSPTLIQAHADDRRCLLDVGVFHPSLPDLPESARGQLVFLVLDWALGEDDVERWIGDVHPLPAPPLDAIPAAMLYAVVDQLRERWTGDRWALIEGEHGGTRLLASVRHPLHRVDYPLLDEHVGVRLTYEDITASGMPGENGMDDLRSFEEMLVSRLGSSAELVAHETTSGERVLHLYGDVTNSVVPLIEAVLPGYQGGRASVTSWHDPAWRAVDHLRPS
jgi:Family of unknown function (DUF695)